MAGSGAAGLPVVDDDLFTWEDVTDPYRQALRNGLKHQVTPHPWTSCGAGGGRSSGDSSGGGGGGGILTVVEPSRVVVYSAPDGRTPRGRGGGSLSVHASFTFPSPLPVDVAPPYASHTTAQLSLPFAVDLAWTRFEEESMASTATFDKPSSSRGPGDSDAAPLAGPFDDASRHSSPAFLCVLVQSTVYIWNVYPTHPCDGSLTDVTTTTWRHDASWTVALPFDGLSIHPLPAPTCGLLICRQPDPEDEELPTWGFPHDSSANAAVSDAQPSAHAMTMNEPHPHEGEEYETNGMPARLPSVYTLTHPLEDVVPVMELLHPSPPPQPPRQDASAPESSFLTRDRGSLAEEVQLVHAPWLDATEEVIWVGGEFDPPEGSPKRSDSQATCVLCATYHPVLRRHAFWSLRPAPSPPPPVPLHQQLKARISTPFPLGAPLQQEHQHGPGNVENYDGAGAYDAAFQPAGGHSLWLPPEDSSPTPQQPSGRGTTNTRDEALAEALGVAKRLSPRPAESGMLLSSSSHHHHAPSLHRASIGAYQQHTANASVELPIASPRTHHQVHTNQLHSSHESYQDFLKGAGAGQSTIMSPQESISGGTHSAAPPLFSAPSPIPGGYWEATCLHAVSPSDVSFEDQAADGTSITRVFALARDGSLDRQPLLCLLHQRELRFFRVTAFPSASPELHVEPWDDVTMRDCHDAVPVQDGWILVLGGQPASLNAATSLNSGMAPSSSPSWKLCRGPAAILSCRLPGNSSGREATKPTATCYWVDSVHECATVRYTCGMGQSDRDGGNDEYWRVRVSMKSATSPLARRTLTVIQAAMARLGESTDGDEGILGSTIQADVYRLERRITKALSEEGSLVVCDDPGFAALTAVIMTLVESALLGSVGGGITSQPELFANTRRTFGDAWAMLLSSDFHQSYEQLQDFDMLWEAERISMSAGPVESGDLFARRVLSSIGSLSITVLCSKHQRDRVVPLLFEALHYLYEECKLSSSSAPTFVPRLATLLQWIVSLAGSDDDTAARFHKYYRDCSAISASQVSPLKASNSIRMSQITDLLEPPSILHWVDSRMKGDTQWRDAFEGTSRVLPACSRLRSVVRVFKLLFSSDSSKEQRLQVVHTLLGEGFTERRLIHQLAPGLALPLLEFLYQCRTDPSLAGLPGWSRTAWKLVGREDLSRELLPSCRADDVDCVSSGDVRSESDQDDDGLIPMEVHSAMLFPQDNRVREAARLLRSSRPIFLRVNRPVEASDHDYERLKQKRLAVLGTRALSLSVGRGMLTIGSLRPIEAERLPIPELCLKGRAPTTNATIAIDESESPADLRVWPEFHNGVAAGLRLPASSDMPKQISRTWIMFNRPPPSPATAPSENDADPLQQRQGHLHAGVLLALGLRGHLTSLEMSDIHEYLTQGSVTTTVGVLLGMAANKRGTCDVAVSKMLCLHVPSLIPQHFTAIDIASPVQAAAVIGCGLLFQGSSHRMMTEFLLNEIGRRPDSDASANDRDSYTLACGLALGMVNLAIGDKSGGDRGAGIADLRVEDRLYRYMVGGVDSDESRRRREANDRFSVPLASLAGENEKCCTIYEGALINTAITAPAATLALGLMYMKSGNRTIAAALSIPDTHFLLEFVRPDFLGLRLVSKALILWDEVEASDAWIERQVPSVVKSAYHEMRSIAKGAMEGSASQKSVIPDYDRRAIRQIHAHLISGACFGMGLRFAGTGDPGAKHAITQRVLELLDLRQGQDPVSIASRPEEPVLETCLCTAAISLGLVMAGSGDLETLRLLKIVRWRCEEDSRYGHHMMYSMAIGLLFLGGGKCAVGRRPEDLAALITAFYPRFPATTSDNEYHLQPLRHLYALAVRRHDVVAVDVDTNEPVHLPVQVTMENSSYRSYCTPFLLQNSDIPYDDLRVSSRDYYPIKVSLRCQHGGFVFYVKKSSSIVPEAASFGMEVPCSVSVSSNPFLRAYTKYMVRSSDSPFTFRFLQECIADDTDEALSLYLSLVDQPAASLVWDIRLFQTYYKCRHRILSGHSLRRRLMNPDLLLPCMRELAERRLLSMDRDGEDISRIAGLMYGE
jgi:Anaphase-promoting complex subunit 1